MKHLKSVLSAALMLTTLTPTAQTPSTRRHPATQHPPLTTHYSPEQLAEMTTAYGCSRSQDVVPPTDLREQFRRDFPLAADAEWETANGLCEVSFEIRSRDLKALYDSSGRLLLTSEEIRRSALPSAVRKAATAKYPDRRIGDPCRIRCGAETLYKVEMQQPGSDAEVTLLLRADGALPGEYYDY